MADNSERDRKMADTAFDIAFRGETDGIDQAMTDLFAEHRRHGERIAIARIVSAAKAIGWQAGVGGRETAGAIASYLATSPDEIGPFMEGALSPVDFKGDWIRGGCLSWHATNNEIVFPSDSDASLAEGIAQGPQS